jgi:hypothetical protein
VSAHAILHASAITEGGALDPSPSSSSFKGTFAIRYFLLARNPPVPLDLAALLHMRCALLACEAGRSAPARRRIRHWRGATALQGPPHCGNPARTGTPTRKTHRSSCLLACCLIAPYKGNNTQSVPAAGGCPACLLRWLRGAGAPPLCCAPYLRLLPVHAAHRALSGCRRVSLFRGVCTWSRARVPWASRTPTASAVKQTSN